MRRTTWCWVALCAAACAAAAAQNAEEVVVALEHAFGDEDFRPRGGIVVSPKASRNKLVRLTTPSLDLDVDAARRLAAVDGMYRLRGRVGDDGPWASTAVPICWLAAAGFVEELEIFLAPTTDVVSLSYRNLGPGACSLPADTITLDSSVQVAVDVVAQVIPVQLASGKPPPALVQAVKDQGGDGPDHDETQAKPKGFFARYWHVIIPVTLIFLTAKADPPAPAPAAAAPPANT